MKGKIAILIPVYNDWSSLPLLIQRMDEVFFNTKNTIELFIIDDFSSLKPSKFIQPCTKKKYQNLSCITQLTLCRNMGHQAAIAIGLSHIATHSDYECVVIMDADGEDRPEDIPLLLNSMRGTNNSSIIFASRRNRKENIFFKGMYSIFKKIHLLLTGKLMDIGNFSVIPFSLVNGLTSFSELWIHYPATVIKSKLPMKKISCDRGTRIEGRSKMSFTAIYQKVPEGYIAFVEGLPGANTQGKTLEETRENSKEAIKLVLEAYKQFTEDETAGKEVIREKIEVSL